MLSNFLESCLWSIAEIDYQSIDVAIQTFDISAEIVSIYSAEITLILNELLLIACPGQPMCAGHGSCSNSLCVCDAG